MLISLKIRINSIKVNVSKRKTLESLKYCPKHYKLSDECPTRSYEYYIKNLRDNIPDIASVDPTNMMEYQRIQSYIIVLIVSLNGGRPEIPYKCVCDDVDAFTFTKDEVGKNKVWWNIKFAEKSSLTPSIQMMYSEIVEKYIKSELAFRKAIVRHHFSSGLPETTMDNFKNNALVNKTVKNV
uniref:Mab-21 domain-containing protein n=1 Tax=Parastrongyloides trichosuri TaxID=131310 RepID=A0A0N4Z8A1_PARTI